MIKVFNESTMVFWVLYIKLAHIQYVLPNKQTFPLIHEFLLLGKTTLLFISIATIIKYLSLKWVILCICKNLFGYVVPPSDVIVIET